MPPARNSVACILLACVALLAPGPVGTGFGASDYEWFDPVIVVRRFLLDGFYEQPDEEQLRLAMITAMVDSLDDPYTVYVPPTAQAEFDKALRGTYVGIGAEVNIVDDYLTIVTPLEDSPALAAGVQAGDVVLAIEGQETIDRSIDECIELLLGEPGTPVNVRVRHLDGVEEDITIIRDRIVTPSVKGVRRIGEAWDYWLDQPRGIAYARITQFNDTTVPRLIEALEPLSEAGLHGLVLDLRSNPGGELNVAIETADLFLDEGIIVSVRGRNRRPESWHANREGTLPEFPMVVLVNGHSASAAEIVAGALQENGRAKVLGTRTYGKGSVQEVHELPYGQGTLKMTSGHYYLASGRNISHTSDNPVWGVDPDPGFVVNMSTDMLLEMMLARQQYDAIRRGAARRDPGFSNPDWIRAELKDPQMAAALQALQARVAGEPWPVLGGDDPTLLALEERLDARVRFRARLLEQLDAVEESLVELGELAEQAGRQPLLPPGADLAGGRLTVQDGSGAVIGAFDIEGGDLEQALRQIRLTRVTAGEPPAQE